MTNLDDSILLLDRNLAIKTLNRKAEHTLVYSHKPAQPKFLSDFFELNDSFRINWTKLTAVRDPTGDFTGILCKENIADDMFPLEQDLKITKKEREILKGILDGRTNRRKGGGTSNYPAGEYDYPRHYPPVLLKKPFFPRPVL